MYSWAASLESRVSTIELPAWIQTSISFSSVAPMKHDCSAGKNHLLLLQIISLSLDHWGMQTLLNSLPRQQNCNKYSTANSLHARNRKKSKAWNSQCISWKRKTPFRETNSPCPSGQQLSLSGELLSDPLSPSWQKMTLLRASCLSGREAKLQILNSATLRENITFSKKLGTFT